MRLLLLFSILLIAGCTHTDSVATSSAEVFGPPDGELILSLKRTEGAFLGPISKDTGFFLYRNDLKWGASLITGYEYKDGRIIDEFGGDSYSSDKFQEGLAAINFEPFDYSAEGSRAWGALMESGDEFWVTADGWVWEIYIKTNNGSFVVEQSNPGTYIRDLAPFSENFRKLQSVLELVNGYYGETKIGIL
ncbi:MAG: hypothetical protein GY881_07965 [Gammaproteobacteria bacterium]|nr:hypothetical protein [Gammaproteobacteria bacterium]